MCVLRGWEGDGWRIEMNEVSESEIFINGLRGCLEGSVELPGAQWCILRWNCGVGVHERS